MGSLLAFIWSLRAFWLFLGLEAACLYLIVQDNTFQRVAYMNTSNEVVAKTYEAKDRVGGYFALATVNNELAAENARLLGELERLRVKQEALKMDSLAGDTTRQYGYIVAKVINNSVSRVNNYLTLNQGLKDGVAPGMGVVGPTGVVGRVRNCSDHFSTVTSLLHSKMVISAEIAKYKAFGTIRWKGTGPKDAQLLYIARHLKPQKGDTVVTSSLSSVFPPGVMVGRISRVSIKDDDTFYDLDVELSSDFGTLDYVYIANNYLRGEQDSLEAKLPSVNE